MMCRLYAWSWCGTCGCIVLKGWNPCCWQDLDSIPSSTSLCGVSCRYVHADGRVISGYILRSNIVCRLHNSRKLKSKHLCVLSSTYDSFGFYNSIDRCTLARCGVTFNMIILMWILPSTKMHPMLADIFYIS